MFDETLFNAVLSEEEWRLSIRGQVLRMFERGPVHIKFDISRDDDVTVHTTYQRAFRLNPDVMDRVLDIEALVMKRYKGHHGKKTSMCSQVKPLKSQMMGRYALLCYPEVPLPVTPPGRRTNVVMACYGVSFAAPPPPAKSRREQGQQTAVMKLRWHVIYAVPSPLDR